MQENLNCKTLNFEEQKLNQREKMLGAFIKTHSIIWIWTFSACSKCMGLSNCMRGGYFGCILSLTLGCKVGCQNSSFTRRAWVTSNKVVVHIHQLPATLPVSRRSFALGPTHFPAQHHVAKDNEQNSWVVFFIVMMIARCR